MADKRLIFTTFHIFYLILRSAFLTFRTQPTLFIFRKLRCIKQMLATSTKFRFVFGMTVMGGMHFACQKFKVLNRIIKPIPIFMMNTFTPKEFSPKILFHNKTMSKKIITIDTGNVITKPLTNIPVLRQFVHHISIITQPMADIKLGEEVCYRR